jgi:hypothetical protein
MAPKLIKHGTRAGYEAELAQNNVCERCRRAKTVYQRQYTRKGRAAGLRYRTHDVIDNLYDSNTTRPNSSLSRQESSVGPVTPPARQATDVTEHATFEHESTEDTSIGQRLGDALRKLSGPDAQPYVSTDEMPGYLHTVDPDPEPQDADSSRVRDEDFIITKDGMVHIEQNMGTYLSVIGMTLEMVDPYCGPILADNFDNIVGRWSKVVARYPAAAKFFMSEGGGMIMDWIGAIQATWPVLYALYEHHLARTVRTDKGRVMRVVGNANGPDVDATMPPEYDYTTR